MRDGHSGPVQESAGGAEEFPAMRKSCVMRATWGAWGIEQAVTACAVGMLAEKEADELRTAVNRDLNCADVASTTRRVLTRGTDSDHALLAAQLQACVMACEHSHELCAQHAQRHEHCRLCSEATDRAAIACREVLRSLRD